MPNSPAQQGLVNCASDLGEVAAQLQSLVAKPGSAEPDHLSQQEKQRVAPLIDTAQQLAGAAMAMSSRLHSHHAMVVRAAGAAARHRQRPAEVETILGDVANGIGELTSINKQNLPPHTDLQALIDRVNRLNTDIAVAVGRLD